MAQSKQDAQRKSKASEVAAAKQKQLESFSQGPENLLTTNQGVAHPRQPQLAQGGRARADAAGRLHPAREDHPLRPRAHSRAGGACARRGRARLLRADQVAGRIHAGRLPAGGGHAHAGVRALLHRGGLARLVRHGARRARLRGQVLHARGQLRPGGQQHPGVLRPGRDEVSRTWFMRSSPSRTTRCRRRPARTTPSGISSR